ncbi:MAG TPA: SulP family inorganic anion transporter, partial [Trichocoleus sp.]
TGLDAPTVGDMGTLPSTLPALALPQVPFTLETLQIIFPYALALSVVGLMESFLTASVLDDMTDTPSNKNQEAVGQGVANIATGFLGGMAGCALIGQSIINIRSGGRTRLSTLSSGVFLLLFILVADSWVARIPMAVLTAVMVMVAFSTFSWHSLRNIRSIPRSETAVMLTTVVTTLLTHNLAIGVAVGIALSTTFFSRKIARMIQVSSTLTEDGTERIYTVSGQIFFVSVQDFLQAFDLREAPRRVTIDLTHAHLWDQTAVDAVDKIVLGFRRRGSQVELIGLNAASATLLDRLAIHDKPYAVENAALH